MISLERSFRGGFDHESKDVYAQEPGLPQLCGQARKGKVSYATGAMNLQYDEAILDEEKVKDLIRQFSLELVTVLPGKVE